MIKDYLISLRDKKTTVFETTKEYLDRIEELNPTLNAYITVEKESALKVAQEIDQLIADSSNFDQLLKSKPLLGVQVALKDIYSTKDIKTTAGSNILDNYIPPYDATVVRKIKDAGAIILGKLNCDAFAHGGSGENSDRGDTKNPYNLSVTPGGSSSGSGAAIAANLCMVAMGTDTGGSIRNPACFTNTVGIKPTYGRVSRYGVIAMASSLDTIGHITKSVEDSAYFLNITAGHDPLDATSYENKSENDFEMDLESSIKGLKIGLPKEYFSDAVDKQIQDRLADVVKEYTKLGAEVVEISLPSTKDALAVYYIITPSEISSNLARFDGIRFGHDRSHFGAEAKRRIMIGTYLLSSGYYDAYYLKAQKVRTLIIDDFKTAFEKVDVILSPVSPSLPFELGQKVADPLHLYLMDIFSITANLAGIPGIAVPAGFSSEGLPIGFQLLGNYLAEKTLYKVAKAYENTDFYKSKSSERSIVL